MSPEPGKTTASIQAFETFLREYPRSGLRTEALFRMGEIQYDVATTIRPRVTFVR